jgi:hypothetical protein
MPYDAQPQIQERDSHYWLRDVWLELEHTFEYFGARFDQRLEPGIPLQANNG